MKTKELSQQWDEQLKLYRSVEEGIQIRKKHGNQSPQVYIRDLRPMMYVYWG